MKQISLIAMLAISLLLSHKTYAQQAIAQADCVDSVIIHQADSVKELYAKQGFLLVKENALSMESRYELPIVLELGKGEFYQFVFIGDAASILYELRMYDWNEKQIQYIKKNQGDPSYNIIDFSYIPEATQYYMIKPLQVNKKKKKMCGYVLLFKRPHQ
jgi:hypothetical protein